MHYGKCNIPGKTAGRAASFEFREKRRAFVRDQRQRGAHKSAALGCLCWHPGWLYDSMGAIRLGMEADESTLAVAAPTGGAADKITQHVKAGSDVTITIKHCAFASTECLMATSGPTDCKF